MFISQAYAAATDAATDLKLDALADAPTPFEAFIWNVGLIGVLVLMFYVLLIAPQQRRFKEQNAILSGLKKGDRVVTGGGLIGKIEQVVNDSEVVIDLGNNVKVTALRSTLQGKAEIFLKSPKSVEKVEKKK